MNILDIIIIIILLMYIIVGFKNGVIRELSHLIGIVLVLFLSSKLKEPVGEFFYNHFPDIKIFNGVLDNPIINMIVYKLLAFLFLFVVLLGLYFLIINVSKTINNFINGTIILKLPSKILGAIVGFIKGYIFVFIGMIIVFIGLHNDPMYQDSTIGKFILHKTPIVSKSTGNITESLQEIVEISNGIKDKTIDKTEANIKIIKTLIKYKIIDKSTLQEYLKSNNVKVDVDKLLK